MIAKGRISIVDDDDSVRESLPDLLRSVGLEARPFSSAEAFLASDSLGSTDCLILDVAMPGMSGPELQVELSRRRTNIPIVFVTAQSVDRIAPLVLERGAVACLFKPFAEIDLLRAINTALGHA